MMLLSQSNYVYVARCLHLNFKNCC